MTVSTVYTVTEAARRLQVDPTTIRRWIREGRLKATRANFREWRITDAAIRELENELQKL